MALPQKRRVQVQAFTEVGWIGGTLHLPMKSRLLEHVNHAREFLALTDVRFPAKPDPLHFLALQRDATILIVAPASEPLYNVSIEEQTVHELSCMLAQGTLYGRFKALKGVRVSDYISAVRGFFPLEECDLWLTDRWGRAVSEEHHAHVMVNVRHVIGVTEAAPSSSGA